VAYVITASCIDHADQSCVSVCPVDCITSDTDVDRKFYIDPDGCIDCGSCETACPNSAIFRSDQLPPALAHFEVIDATWYFDPEAARTAVDRLASVA
jgi:NAD-dependent dihydropyrimidine dehydrogenase PreA subunit